MTSAVDWLISKFGANFASIMALDSCQNLIFTQYLENELTK